MIEPLILRFFASCGVLLAGPAFAADHYWQFEQSPGFVGDSIGTADWATNTASPATRPASGRGAKFPSQRAADFTNNASILAANVQPLVASYTIEMFVHFDALDGRYGTVIFDQGVCNAAHNTFAQVRYDGIHGSAFQEVLVGSQASNSLTSYFATGFVPQTGIDYYIALVHDHASELLTFYWKDLTNDMALQSSSIDGYVQYQIDRSLFEVGDLNSGACGVHDFGHDGLIDDIRISYHARSQSELLINDATAGGSRQVPVNWPWLLAAAAVIGVVGARRANRTF